MCRDTRAQGYEPRPAPVAEPHIYRGSGPLEGVGDRQDPQLPACRQLIMHKIHRPGLVEA